MADLCLPSLPSAPVRLWQLLQASQPEREQHSGVQVAWGDAVAPKEEGEDDAHLDRLGLVAGALR